jgi:hypothetical protein
MLFCGSRADNERPFHNRSWSVGGDRCFCIGAAIVFFDVVENYSLEANSFIDALLKMSAQFQFSLGVEWVKSADTLKSVRVTRSHTTVADVIQAVISEYAGYEWRTEDGVVHVFQRDLTQDARNPLNVTIKSFDELPETVGWANNNLFQMVSRAVRHPELSGISGSVPGSPGEPIFRFKAENAPARNILNQIVTCSTGTTPPTPRMNRIWIATFPERPLVSRTGFLEVVPMWNPKFVSDEDQPFWVLRPWGDPPLENMVK